MTVTDINRAIMFGDLTNDELNSVVTAVKWARAQMTKQNIRSISRGSQVKFKNNRDGRTYTGIVRKIAIKYVTVESGNLLFRVPASMLEAA